MEKPKDFPENIILIGMFGSGKSTLGRILAARLRYHFLDTDHIIESRFKKPLQKVLERLGMAAFMKMEEETILALHPRHCVISAGGSAVYYPRAMEYFRTLGPRVYLKVPLKELRRRMPHWSERGVVCRGGSDIGSLLKERTPLLRKYADLTLEAYGRPWEDMAEDILKSLGVRLGPPVTAVKTPEPAPEPSPVPERSAGKKVPKSRKP